MAGSEGAIPVISVVVPTYRRGEQIGRLLAALGEQTLARDRFEILVVDDCSGDGSAVKARVAAVRLGLEVAVSSTEANGGPAAARNLGWRTARAPVIAFIDDDCVPEAAWLASGLAAMERNPGIGVAQGRTVPPPGTDLAALPRWAVWRTVDAAGPYFEGCNIFYRRAALEDVGGFDQGLRWWGEDTAAGWKVTEQGWGRSFVPAATVVHDIDPRGWWWNVVNGLREGNVVVLAARHPGFRAEAWWRPWAFRRDDAAFVLGVVSVVGAIRWRPLILGCLPYLRWRGPALRSRGRLRAGLEVATVDLARAMGQLCAAWRHRLPMV